MYKKIFSAILFGVLTIASTSTFVSCKDYDDDINNLQAQIDELNNQKLVVIQESITKLDAAYKAADAAQLETVKVLIAEAIKDCKDACAEKFAAQAEQNAKFDEAITKVNQRVDDVLKLLSDQDGNIQEVGKQLQALSNKLSTFETEFGTLSEAFRDLTKRVTNLEDAYKAQAAALEKLAKEVNGSDGEPGSTIDPTLKDEIEKAGTRIDELEKKIADLKTELTKKINDEIKAVNDKLASEVGKINTTIDELRAAHENFATKAELAELSGKVAEVKTFAEGVAADLGKLDVMFQILASDLRSLVYMPKLYIDGIETIEYPYLRYALLHATDTRAYTRYENDLTAPRAPQNLGGEIYDLIDKDLNDSISYGPSWPIQYHMNPGNAAVEFSDVQGYYAYNAEVMTRAFYDTKNNIASNYGIIATDRWDNWYDENDVFFSTKGGILNVGLKLGDKVANADYNVPGSNGQYFPGDVTEDQDYPYTVRDEKNIILALQVKSSLVNKKDTTITSDYAQLLPEKVKIEGLIWYKGKTPKYWDNDNERIKDFWENKKGYGPATALAAGATPGAPTYQHNPAGWDYGYRKGDQSKTMGRDTLCPVTAEWIHVWETPEDALMHPADIELYINKPISLVEHLGVHWYFEQDYPLTDNVRAHKPVKTWYYNDKELQRYGFVWVFDTLDYFVDTNETHDSRYITVNNHHTGLIEAQNVRESGATYEDETHTAVGREPLVRVRLYHFSNIKDMESWKNLDKNYEEIKKFNAANISKDKNSKYAPVLDGYIRVHITRPELLEIDKFKFNDLTFDLCNDAASNWTTWAQFNQWVLKEALKGMEKEQFDALYNVEQEGSVDDVNKVMELVQYSKPRTPLAEDDKYYTYKKLTAAPANWKPNKNNKDDYKIGRIYTRWDEVGTTNHTYRWAFTAEELEALTHCATASTADNGSNPITLERYIHYTGHFYSSTDPNNAGARYDDIFIKLTITIKRQEVPMSITKQRDENNWYNWEGSWLPFYKATNDLTRLQSIANNTPYPEDGLGNTSRTVAWRNNILYTWDGDKIQVSNAGDSKFYFAPFEYEIKAQDGTVYIVTPRRGSTDNVWNQMFCKYWNESHVYQLDKNNPFNSAELEKNNETLKNCAIRYQPDVAGILKAYNMNVTTVDDPSAWPKCDGVFSNDTLYAVLKSEYSTRREYEPIAIITTNETSLVTKDNYDIAGDMVANTGSFAMRDGAGQVVLLHEYVENKWLKEDAQPSGNKYTQASEWDKENVYAEDCVNAVGYILDEIGKDADGHMTGDFKDKGNPLNKQLRSYVGVIATQKCNIANQMNDNRTKNFAVFQMAWERPVNMLKEFDFMVDAINNGDFLYVVDLIKLFDWRGASNKSDDGGFDTGYMWGSTGIPSYWTNREWRRNQWLWAYYNVRAINLDLRTSKVLTDHSHPGEFKPISDPSNANAIQLTARGLRQLVTFQYPDFGSDLYFPLRTSPTDFNAVSENEKLIEYMGLDNPRIEGLDAVKGKFGWIRYENNGQNVHDFDVKIPLWIVYDWGKLYPGDYADASDKYPQYITIHIKHTRGND